MAYVSLKSVVNHCDRLLRTKEVGDYDRAVNGLQVANSGRVSRIAAAVDASLATITEATEAGATLMIVHHGLFWTASYPWTGRKYDLIRLLINSDLAVYSSHLPLDVHPKLGNNALLCDALKLKPEMTFFPSHGQDVGLISSTRISRDELGQRLALATGRKPLVVAGGHTTCRRIGIVTGGAGGDIAKAAAAGIDTFITGEGPHWTVAVAEELGVNVFYAGHYATETFGVKALAAELSRKFKVPWSFIDHPTGL